MESANMDATGIRVTVVVQKDGDWYVAKCLENSVASQGRTIEKSIENLRCT